MKYKNVGFWKIFEVISLVLPYQKFPFVAPRLKRLSAQLKSLRQSASALSTNKTRTSQWKSFTSFCKEFRLQALPACERTVALYIAHLSEKLQYSTVRKYVANVISFHHANDFHAPDLSNFLINEALVGVQRTRHELPNKRNPILPQDLAILHSSLGAISKRHRATFWTACLVGFFSLLRSSNLFRKQRSNLYLTVADISFTAQGATVSATVSKTHRFLSKNIVLPLPKLPFEHPLCPVAALQRMLRKSRARDSDALFSYRSGFSGKIHVFRWFNKLLARAARLSGLSHAWLSTHSFRRGGATYAASVGIPRMP